MPFKAVCSQARPYIFLGDRIIYPVGSRLMTTFTQVGSQFKMNIEFYDYEQDWQKKNKKQKKQGIQLCLTFRQTTYMSLL